MSDSGDDWENQLDSDNEKEEEKKKQEELEKKKAAFGDEDTVDQKELAKEKELEKKKAIEEQMANARVREGSQIDYDKKFEERQKKMAGIVSETKEIDTTGMSAQQKQQALEKQSESKLAD